MITIHVHVLTQQRDHRCHLHTVHTARHTHTFAQRFNSGMHSLCVSLLTCAVCGGQDIYLNDHDTTPPTYLGHAKSTGSRWGVAAVSRTCVEEICVSLRCREHVLRDARLSCDVSSPISCVTAVSRRFGSPCAVALRGGIVHNNGQDAYTHANVHSHSHACIHGLLLNVYARM